MDSAGDLYIADSGNDRILKFAPNEAITTVSGLDYTLGVAVNSAGKLYIATRSQW